MKSNDKDSIEVYFEVQDEQNRIKTFRLKADTHIIIGRSSKKSRVVVEDERASGQHCKISFNGRSLFVEDLCSKNGTLLNSIGIDKQQFYLGDIIYFGSTKVYVSEDRINDYTKKLISYSGLEDRSAGEITLKLEIDIDHIPFTVDSQVSNNDYHMNKVRRQREIIQEEEEDKNRNVLMKLIDFVAAAFFFYVSINTFKIYNPKIAHSISKQWPDISKIMDSDEFMAYFFICLLVTLSLHIIHVKYIKRSIGKIICGS